MCQTFSITLSNCCRAAPKEFAEPATYQLSRASRSAGVSTLLSDGDGAGVGVEVVPVACDVAAVGSGASAPLQAVAKRAAMPAAAAAAGNRPPRLSRG